MNWKIRRPVNEIRKSIVLNLKLEIYGIQNEICG